MKFEWDEANDILRIDGYAISGDYLRQLVESEPLPGRLFQVIRREDGAITIQAWAVDQEEFERWHTARLLGEKYADIQRQWRTGNHSGNQ